MGRPESAWQKREAVENPDPFLRYPPAPSGQVACLLRDRGRVRTPLGSSPSCRSVSSRLRQAGYAGQALHPETTKPRPPPDHGAKNLNTFRVPGTFPRAHARGSWSCAPPGAHPETTEARPPAHPGARNLNTFRVPGTFPPARFRGSPSCRYACPACPERSRGEPSRRASPGNHENACCRLVIATSTATKQSPPPREIASLVLAMTPENRRPSDFPSAEPGYAQPVSGPRTTHGRVPFDQAQGRRASGEASKITSASTGRS